ncbi:MAG TPA: TylF/MycF/NovP-related O-methyltransferase [Bacteroidales bacterium]|nr:TylF/MycF/NovP-related O-methyltransferase [Bacteroidales bacterium]
MDPVQFINLISLIIAGLALVFLARYLWTSFFGGADKPLRWQQDKQAGKVPQAVLLTEGQYPDKVRFYNFWFQLSRILDENIPGSLAELGVYKGETARLLHHAAPDRLLYLFDTFSGFPATDLQGERGEAATYTPRHFADTSVEKVLRTIGASRNLVVRQGYFPETAAGLEDERFALVSMDADLYKPTLAGLHFFYPRLSPGGVLLIHDHDARWPGILQAVQEFSAGIPESFIPIPDMHSTMMLVKNRRPSS